MHKAYIGFGQKHITWFGYRSVSIPNIVHYYFKMTDEALDPEDKHFPALKVENKFYERHLL